VVQPVPRSMMNAGVVDQEVQRQAVERPPPGRPAPVHGHTGTLARRDGQAELTRTSSDRLYNISQVGRCQSMDTLVHQHGGMARLR